MPQALPTPYDITEIPLIPWSPGTQEWLVLFALTVVGLLLTAVWHAFKRGRGLRGIVPQLLREIERSSRQPTGASAERISRAARRVIEHSTRHALSGLSSHEIRAYAEQCTNVDERTALTLIGELESRSYAPPTQREPAQLEQLARELLASLKVLTDPRRRS